MLFDDLDEQLQKIAADNERIQADQNLCHNDVWLAEDDLVKSVHPLELTKQQFDLPSRLIELRDIRRAILFSRQIHYIQLIALFLCNPDTDDTGCLNGTRSRAVEDAPFELDFAPDVDDVLVKIFQELLNLLPFQENGIAAPFPKFVGDFGFCVGLEPREEPAAVGINEIYLPVVKVGLNNNSRGFSTHMDRSNVDSCVRASVVVKYSYSVKP